MGVPFEMSGEPFEGGSLSNVKPAMGLAHLSNLPYSDGRYNFSRRWRRERIRDHFTILVIYQNHTYSRNLKRMRTAEKNEPLH